MPINQRPFDRRVTDRYLEKGLIKEADLKAYLKGLPDEAPNAQWVEMELHDAEMNPSDNGIDEAETA